MQALSPTEDSVKQSSSTTLTWKEPVELASTLRGANGVSGSSAGGPAGDLHGMNTRNGPPFNTQQQLGTMNVQHNFRPQNGHQEFGGSFVEPSRQNGIPESVMVMPLIESKLSSASRSSSSSPPSSRKAVRSRARPRKPEEPVPFLSVDTLPADRIVTEGKLNSSKQLSKKQSKSVPKRISPDFIPPATGRRSQTPNHPPFSPYGGGKSTPRVPSRAGSSLHNYNSFFTHKNSAFLAGPPSLWSLGNRFWPHQATPNEGRRRLAPIQAPMALEASTLKSNYQVSQPFKHSVDNSTPIERPVSPSQELKESTMLALHEVTQALARQRDPPPSRKGGRLLKGKLKPLHTFQMDGPGIDECQGILTEDERGQTADKARLLQRKKELLSMLPPDVFQRSAPGSSLHTRPNTQESVHRTSIVSALSLDRDYPTGHPSLQQGQLRSQSMVEGAPPVGPFNSMVTVIDDSVVNQVDIPAVEVQQDGRGDPEEKSQENADHADYSMKEEGVVPDPERLMAGGDADKLSDAVSESNMSDYLSELEGGRAEILCNMVKKNSQASTRNDVTQLDDEPSDATELENGYDDAFPLDTVQQKDPALDTTCMSMSDDKNKKGPSAPKTEIQSNLDDHDDTNSNSVVAANASMDGNKPKSDSPEQTDSAIIPKDDRPQSQAPGETCEQNEKSMQTVENEQKTIPTIEHLEQPDVSQMETKVPEKAIIDHQMEINVDHGSAILNEQSKTAMQNATDDVPKETNFEDNRTDSMNDSNMNIVPVLNKPQDVNNIPSISAVNDGNEAAVEKDILNNNVEETNVREGSGNDVDEIAVPQNSDFESRTDSSERTMAVASENSSNILSNQLEQKTVPMTTSAGPSEEQEQTEMGVEGEIPSSSANQDNSIAANANSSETKETQDDENVVNKQNSEVLSSAMKEEDDKEQENKEEEEVDNDGKDTKDNDNDKGTGGGGGGDGGSSSGQGGSSNSDEGGASQGGGASGEGGSSSSGGGEGDGDGNDRDNNSRNDQNGTNSDPTEEEEAKNEENEEICFKSLEQLLQEIQAQSLRRKEDLTSYDDIPEVDDPVLYCGNCGLDEDACVCPNSSLHKLLSQVEFTNQPELEDDKLLDESSQQENIVLEYKMLLGESHPVSGCYSDDLVSPREAWKEDDQHESRRSRPRSGLPDDMMLATGVAMTPAPRPISGKVRPGSSRLPHTAGHQGPKEEGGAKVSLENADILSDSGCGSEMSEAMTQASQLLTDEMEEEFDDDLDLKAQDQEQWRTETTENESKSANLEIVASTKPRHAKHKTDDAPMLAPFPPLCFKINARPPPGKLYYFAYGPTMNPARLSTYVGSQVEPRLWGILFGFALKFNKKGQDIEAGGFANIEFSPESSVEGCVYCMNPSQQESLDKFMGCPEFYIKVVLPVWMVNCDDPNEFGVAQYCVPAVMYIAQDKWTHRDESAPLASGYSIRQCMKGADLLSPAYKQHMQTLVC